MSKILPIVLSPDPILSMVSKPVDKVDDEIRRFMDDMLATMYNASGVGLAAVQVDRLERILVMDASYEIDNNHQHNPNGGCCDGKAAIKNAQPICMVNPEIVEKSKELYNYKEGCLSFPDSFSDVKRPEKVKVKFLNYEGNEQIDEYEGLLAVCVQHEIDHLDGITFVDHLSRLKREMIMKRLLKRKREM